jgi:hypothetical protein
MIYSTNSMVDQTEEEINELKDRLFEITQLEEKRKKKLERN